MTLTADNGIIQVPYKKAVNGIGRYKSPEAQANNTAYRNEYERQHYDRITILLPKGKKKDLQEYAEANGKTVSRLIIDLLEDNWII